MTKFFRFEMDSVHVEADDINQAHNKFCAQMWFPGMLYVQEVDTLGMPIGDKVNLRMPTNQGVEFEMTRAKNRQDYNAACINALVRICEQLGVKIFSYSPDENGDADIKFQINERGQAFYNNSQGPYTCKFCDFKSPELPSLLTHICERRDSN